MSGRVIIFKRTLNYIFFSIRIVYKYILYIPFLIFLSKMWCLDVEKNDEVVHFFLKE